MSFREAAAYVRRRFMLNLKDAPFDTKDAKLVVAAGACTKCPFRTGNAPGLFEDVDDTNVCTKPACWKDKCDAAWAHAVARRSATRALDVIEGKRVKDVLPYGEHPPHNSIYVRADSPQWFVKDQSTGEQENKPRGPRR
jgi:hypothetical protein